MCTLAKSDSRVFHPNNTIIDSHFLLIHLDVWDRAPENSSNGFLYSFIYIDDYTRMTWVYFLKQKSKVFEKFVEFYNFVKTQYQQKN